MKKDQINISKEEIFSGKIKDETVSEMAKMTAKQVYWQGFNSGIDAAIDAMKQNIESVRSLKK